MSAMSGFATCPDNRAPRGIRGAALFGGGVRHVRSAGQPDSLSNQLKLLVVVCPVCPAPYRGDTSLADNPAYGANTQIVAAIAKHQI